MARSAHWTKDWLLLGLATGITASITKSLVNAALDKAGVPTAQYGSYAGGWMLGRKAHLGRLQGLPRTPGENALGWVADTLYGGIFGAGISYLISKTPPGHEVLKGMAGGATLWATVIGGLHQLKQPRTYTAGQLGTMLGLNMFYGGLQGAMLQRLGQRAVEERQPLAPERTSPGDQPARLVATPRAAAAPRSPLPRPDARQPAFGFPGSLWVEPGGGFGDGFLDGRDYFPTRD